MHCCQGPEDKVGTRTNEIKLPVNKLRAKVSRRFLINQRHQSGKTPWRREGEKPDQNTSFKEPLMEKDPSSLPIVAQERGLEDRV